MKKENNAKQSIFNEKYEIVLHTSHSNARWCVWATAYSNELYIHVTSDLQYIERNIRFQFANKSALH